MERITSAQPPPCMAKHPSLEIADMSGMDFPMYVYKPRRGGMKRGEDSKDTYKLPHRLIEKKRRDRINECIAQLKDLLPEHLKLTTLGHLEKAVVLELTLKHVKAMNSLLEQQQQKIISLQNGLKIGEQGSGSPENSEEMFRSGFHLCAKEVLQYLANKENSQDTTPLHVMRHLQKVSSELLQGAESPRSEEPAFEAPESREKPASGPQPKAPEGHAKNCVPVIQRTYTHGNGEQSGSDTDTDSGYGGELEKRDAKAHQRVSGYYAAKEVEMAKYGLSERVKQESDEPQAKRQRADSSEDESLSGHEAVAGHGGYVSFSPHQAPLCMPFYLIPPSTAAAYLPMLDKCWYPGGMPVLYPGMGGSPPSLSPEKLPSSLVMSPRVGSPTTPQTPMDSPALLQALKQVPPLNLETKD
ncbi:class E basic helix-loop-helix protein 40 [Alosa pseudoharengus]|uniref:class E basic helix-loop-helix protein 40 n=1 Tax=Alosa pseudoharengus TaxID=34774 RepID=UPI003F88E7AC